MIIYSKEQILSALELRKHIDALINTQQQAFIDFYNKKITMPMPIQLSFPENAGDCHIKAGFKTDDEYFIIKIATGFYNNYSKGLPSGDGAILAFSQRTGLLAAILLDAGYLTTLRTALAACIAAQLTPFAVNNIGIVGNGNLAAMVLETMSILYPAARFIIWGRNREKLNKLIDNTVCKLEYASISELTSSSDLIITATASNEPIIVENSIRDKLHIISLGADEPGKHEVAQHFFASADCIIVDNIEQAIKYGDTAKAIDNRLITENNMHELGKILFNRQEPDNAKLLITCLSGISAQDIAISNYVLQGYN